MKLSNYIRCMRVNRLLTKLLSLFALAFVLASPADTYAGIAEINQTDVGSNRVVAPFDVRDRNTYIQVTNIASSPITIHVQFWDVRGQLGECFQFNFSDELTGNDTHVYDVSNVMTNAVPGKPSVDVASVTANSYGFVTISVEEGGDSLIGMFRIVDNSGYEYRANTAGEDSDAFGVIEGIVNFSDANGNNMSDLFGITYISTSPRSTFAGPGVATVFGEVNNSVLIWNENEFDTSCPPATFACAEGFLDRSIDFSLPNSKGEVNQICATNVLNSNNSGFVDLPFSRFNCGGAFGGQGCPPSTFFVGFIGLNNGNGTGSMDSWWATGEDIRRR